MNAKSVTVGVVIAGGRSVRFGGEKAVALFLGRPLLSWAVTRLSPWCSAVAVNARPDTKADALAREHGLTVLYDLQGDAAGPLAGIHAGLQWAVAQGASRIAVSPCDVPLLPDTLFERLLSAAGEGAAMAMTGEGRQPLCAVWPVSALAPVRLALAGGEHPATWKMLESLGAVPVQFEASQAFTNVNTREDLARIEAMTHQR